MEVNGWRLFQYPLFEAQLTKLAEAVEKLTTTMPGTHKDHPKTKLLATIHRYMMEIIPRNPGAPEFRQGDALGPDNRHWFRAKFHQRYRLFFRFSTIDKVIVYAWVNDESSLRKAGSKTDPYAVFKSMLRAGSPPYSLEDLLKSSKELKEEPSAGKRTHGHT
ncbi:MAG: type II toxin-antitoxin system YhaV family toxin [Terriglobia bacterium]|jgi:toxin YhaV